MRFKNPSEITDLWVDLDTPGGNKMRIPSEGAATSLVQLVTLVDIEIKNLEKQGYSYLEPLQMQADRAKLHYRVYLGVVIENIICKRQPRPQEACYSDGLGDDLHLVSGKIDKAINALPSPLKKVANTAVRVATRVATGHTSQTLSGCSICGGRKSISAQQSNLGRAGKINRYKR